MIDQIVWLGNGTFILHGTPDSAGNRPTVYVNPWRIASASQPADVILISSDRFDRCSMADVRKLRGENTQVIASERAAAVLGDCTILRPWQSLSLDHMCIKAIPAYHERKGVDGGIGFLISMQFYDVYYAGDTGLIPELSRFSPDIALLPISGNETLNTEEAAQAAIKLGARWVIPYNWGSGITNASRSDALTLARELDGKAETVLLPPNR